MKQFDRFILQIGEDNFKKLQSKKVLLFGLGGVGGNIAEALVRSGIGEISSVDGDKIDITNLNRQLITNMGNIGNSKVDECAKRMLSINPKLIVNKYPIMYPYMKSQIDFTAFDYVIDAIDDIDAKVEIISNAKKSGVKVISCMGTGNKFDPLKLKVDDISKTSVCPLAKIMRRKLKAIGVSDVKCLYSTEIPIQTNTTTISSNAFVPAVAGILIAKEVVMDLIK